jgi:hypothetical protein
VQVCDVRQKFAWTGQGGGLQRQQYFKKKTSFVVIGDRRLYAVTAGQITRSGINKRCFSVHIQLFPCYLLMTCEYASSAEGQIGCPETRSAVKSALFYYLVVQLPGDQAQLQASLSAAAVLLIAVNGRYQLKNLHM